MPTPTNPAEHPAAQPGAWPANPAEHPGAQPAAHAPVRRGHPVLKAVLALLLVAALAVAAYAVALGFSVQRAAALGAGLQRSAANLEVAAAHVETASAAALLGDITADVASLAAELDRWEWDVAAALPVYGADVATARELLGIVDPFVAGVAAPVVDLLERFNQLPASLEALPQGIELVDEARTLVDQIEAQLAAFSQQLDQLPAFKIAQLNNLVTSLRDTIAQTQASLTQLDPYLEQYDTLKGALAALGL